MKKDFEKAYKELANTEVPDLWDRIEAGLSEKSAPKEAGTKRAGTEAAETKDGRESAPVSNQKTKIAVFMRKYSALAAAIVCAVILIPTLLVMKKAGGSSMSDSAAEVPLTTQSAYYDEAVADEAVAEEAVAEEAVVEEAAEAAAEEVPEMTKERSVETEAATGEAELKQEESAKEPGQENRAAATEGFMQDESASGAVKEKAEGAMNDAVDGDAGADGDRQKAVELKNAVMKNIVVKVTKAEEASPGDGAEEMGILYTAVVEKNPSGLLQEGEEIRIFLPLVSSLALFEDSAYELDLTLSELSEEDDIYTIAVYHGEVKE